MCILERVVFLFYKQKAVSIAEAASLANKLALNHQSVFLCNRRETRVHLVRLLHAFIFTTLVTFIQTDPDANDRAGTLPQKHNSYTKLQDRWESGCK